MELNQFKHINNIVGWLMFLFAASVYTLTMESTASLWDCGEFIASAQKMQVVHPPGAALFLMIGRVFTFLSFGNPDLVALSMNFMSALCSGLAAMFLFWIVTQLSRRILSKDSDTHLSTSDSIAILGAGAIAALSAMFLDSVWFSAVEGEVYSMSLMWTTMVFWTILKWEERADQPYGDRWLLLTAFLIGSSIFVHWLNLLTIPAMTFLYYFKRYETTKKGLVITLLTSLFLVAFLLYLIIPGLVDFAANLELFLVNSMGMPFNSGLFVFLALLVGGISFLLYYSYKNNKPVLHNVTLGLMFVLIGYSSIVTVVIRSNSQPNIDMNSPRDLVSLASYLKREQYGSRPFLTGYYYTAEVTGYKETGKKYAKGKDKYDEVGSKIDYEYRGKKVLFPRIYDSNHKQRYESWLGLKPNQKPSFADNIRFFFKYQINHMYIRYFMWNFAGRQNDDQGVGTIKDGNWISGIPFLDSTQIGSQVDLPDHYRNHPVRNTYFFLPLLLGLLGAVFHFTSDNKRAFVVLLLFLFCGIAIIVQGNSPPIEPRERDYIFAGSFYAFSIWLGIGVLAIYDMLKNSLKGSAAPIVATAACLVVPAILGAQNWDDHDRSNRFAARDFAANYLNSCAPNSIIFTQGDNDTYPLWYVQEVEGIRRDVRVVNLSLLGVDWYINQLRRKVNDADPVPMTLDSMAVRGTKRDMVINVDDPRRAAEGQYYPLKDIMQFIGTDKLSYMRDRDVHYFPTRLVTLPVDKEKVLARNAIEPEKIGKMVNELKWEITKRSLLKNDMMVLDIIAANNWERPIYFAISVDPNSYLGLAKYFQLEGMAYRLVPLEAEKQVDPLTGRVDTRERGGANADIMYDNMINKFRFGNIKQEGVHVDTDLRRMLFNMRGNYARLATELIRRGDKDKAVEVLDFALEEMPDRAAPLGFFDYMLANAYYEAGAYEKANALTKEIADKLAAELLYITGLTPSEQRAYDQEMQLNSFFIQKFSQIARTNGQEEFAKELETMLGIVK